MKSLQQFVAFVIALFALLVAPLAVAGTNNDACERILSARGMYTLNALPQGLEQCAGWKEIPKHLQAARSATIMTGHGPGSGTGVMTGPSQCLTNWHNVFEKLPETDAHLVGTGCWASTQDETLPLEGIEILTSVEPTDEEIAQTTATVLAAVKPGMILTDAGKARSDAIDTIEKECEAGLGKDWKCFVDKRRDGLEYALYKHRAYKDVRLVYLPPSAVAYRDADNFEHGEDRGRADLAELLVLDDNGKPVNLPFVPVINAEPKEGDRGFIIGNPGYTNWARTAAMAREQAAFQEIALARHSRVAQLFYDLMKRRPELSGAVAQSLLHAENSVKIAKAEIAEAPDVEEFRRHRDARMRYTIRSLDRTGKIMVEAEEVTRLGLDPAVNCRTNWAERYVFGANLYGPRFVSAAVLNRWARFSAMPEDQRLKGWKNVVEVKKKLDLPPQDVDIESATTGANLELMARYLPEVREALGVADPYQSAVLALKTTSLVSSEVAIRLLEAGPAAIRASTDPLMKIAAAVEKIGWENRPIRARIEEGRARSVQIISLALGQAGGLPAADGADRMILAEVRGHREGDKIISPFATIGALAGRKDIGLPEWFNTAGANDTTVLNLEAEAFTTGGVSGSGLFQVIDGKLGVTGWLFDGNAHQITSGFWQGGPNSRAVIVTAVGIKRFREMAGACEGCGPRRLSPCKSK